jgi:capsular exopolysaccharide synthesis family protein
MNQLSPWRIRRLAGNEEIQPEFSRVREPDEVPLSYYWNVLVKRRNIILPIFFVVFATGSYFALSATTFYTATAMLKIEPQNPRVTGVGELQPPELLGQYDYHQTQFALLQTRALAARVIADLRLETKQTFIDATIVSPNPVDHLKSWLFLPLRLFSYYVAPLFKSARKAEESNTIGQTAAPGDLELTVSPSLIDHYLGFIGIQPIGKTRLVSVQFTTPDPGLSQLLANAHVQTFMRMSLENRFSLTQDAREFLNQKKSELQQKLEKSEAELNKFRRANGVISVEKGENIVVDRLVDLNKQLTVARAQRIEAESLYRTVEKKDYQDLAEVMKQGLVQQLKTNVANLEAEKARSATIFKPDHPRIRELNQQITAARQAFNNEVGNVVQGIKSNYAAAVAKERALESEANKQQEDALKLRELGVDYTLLQEEVNANRSLYENVLKRLSETNVSNDLAVSNMEIAEKAARPLRPSGPNVPLYVFASMVSGLFFGVGAAFLREFLDSSIGTSEDVWRSVGLATLGVVPHLKFLNLETYSLSQTQGVLARSRQRIEDAIARARQTPRPLSGVPPKELITNHSSLSIMNEAYRTIRTSLLLSQPDKPPQVILLTSPSPSEGKTVTSLNLSIALAHDGHNVLLVDADMRKGCCHNRLGLTNNKGLSNVLTGGLSLDDGIQHTSVSGLSLLSRGVPPPNPAELLGSRKMKDVLKELRRRFEFILIDSTPVIAISDAAVLSVLTDGVLLVFDGHKTSTACAQKAVQYLDTVRARFLGVVLNAVNLNHPDYSYYRTYSQYYHSNDDHEHHQEGLKDSDDALITLHDGGQIENGQRPKTPSNYSNDEANDETATEKREGDDGPLLGNEDLCESNEEADLKSAQASLTSAAGRDPSLSGKSVGVLPQAFLGRLINLYIEAVGPFAPMIVRDQMSALGESQHDFPRSRLGELVKAIESEILDSYMRLQFQEQIAEEIRKLGNL